MPDVDYQPYLAQGAYWPRLATDGVDDHVQEILIAEMNPGHAINAYHVLRRWGDARGNVAMVIRTNLARALLNQAVGYPVVYERDLPEAPHVDDFDIAFPITPYELSLEGSYDIVMAIRDIVHPVRQAQELIRLLRRVPTT